MRRPLRTRAGRQRRRDGDRILELTTDRPRDLDREPRLRPEKVRQRGQDLQVGPGELEVVVDAAWKKNPNEKLFFRRIFLRLLICFCFLTFFYKLKR